MSLLRMENISKVFPLEKGSLTVLDHVSLSVEEGECVGLIGESGSGKTTMARIAAGLLEATGGTMYYDGICLFSEAGKNDTGRKISKKEQQSVRASMQMVFQNPQGSFSPRMKLGIGIREGLRYQPENRKLSAKEMDRRVNNVLERVGLPLSYKEKYVFEVSGGEAQRAAIARAIINNPRLLVCDEMTSALDVQVQAQLIELMQELKAQMQMALLFISHDINLVHSFCDRTYVMRKGKIVESGLSEQIFLQPREAYTAQLIKAASLHH